MCYWNNNRVITWYLQYVPMLQKIINLFFAEVDNKNIEISSLSRWANLRFDWNNKQLWISASCCIVSHWLEEVNLLMSCPLIHSSNCQLLSSYNLRLSMIVLFQINKFNWIIHNIDFFKYQYLNVNFFWIYIEQFRKSFPTSVIIQGYVIICAVPLHLMGP